MLTQTGVATRLHAQFSGECRYLYLAPRHQLVLLAVNTHIKKCNLTSLYRCQSKPSSIARGKLAISGSMEDAPQN